jgi:outer membrane lipoprotein SlyB
MRTLLGVFHSLERGQVARDQFEKAGYDVQYIDNSRPASDVTHDVSAAGGEGPGGGAAAGAAFGGMVTGGVGAVPGAILGGAVGKWLSQKRAEEYARDVAEGGVLLIVHAEELIPASEAEALLYKLGADHVENGEVPVP